MPIPKFLQSCLPSYNVDFLDKNDPLVAYEIITQVLNLGDDKAVSWVFENFTLDKIRDSVKKPQKGVWNEESLNYWKQILKLGKIVDSDKSILNINPI